jgi:hypothetical protein
MSDVRVSRLSLMLGMNADVRKAVETTRSKRVAIQIEPDGRQPMERAAPSRSTIHASTSAGSRNFPSSPDASGSISGTSRLRTVDRSARRSISWSPTCATSPANGLSSRLSRSSVPTSPWCSVRRPLRTAPPAMKSREGAAWVRTSEIPITLSPAAVVEPACRTMMVGSPLASANETTCAATRPS